MKPGLRNKDLSSLQSQYLSSFVELLQTVFSQVRSLTSGTIHVVTFL